MSCMELEFLYIFFCTALMGFYPVWPFKTINIDFTFCILLQYFRRCCNWLVNIGREDLSTLSGKRLNEKYVCSDHFQPSDFTNKFMKRLNHNAVPIPHFRTIDYNEEAYNYSSDSDIVDYPEATTLMSMFEHQDLADTDGTFTEVR